MEYGLIGMPLGHSFSKIIQEKISPITYELCPLKEDEVIFLLDNRSFKGINVTIPYKQFVIPHLDEISLKAKEISAVNTIVNKDGKLYGYNTDYDGLKRMLESHHIDPKDKVCAILGNGGTHNTAHQLLLDLGAKKILTVSRKRVEGTISFSELFSHPEIELLINTTPIGMYPNNYNCLVDINSFPNLVYVVDVIYNPIRTPLIVQSKKKGLVSTGGLEMLVNQAIIANEYFLNQKHDESTYKKAYADIYLNKSNIVLIGMPMSGKSTIGNKLAKKLNRKLIDTDEEIIKRIKMTIPEYFKKFGEDAFRKIETEVIEEVSKLNNVIISTGGGVIKNDYNIDCLKQNGFIVFLTRDDNSLIFDSNRPLTKSMDDYQKLKKERLPLYLKAKDVTIENKGPLKETVKRIEEAFYESINY